ncbi:MAG TPA: Rid family hydrolase [Steroidobacteraceae bacterium]|nr:Rid family hydrolase [Steroidobacteraceae bacterium]
MNRQVIQTDEAPRSPLYSQGIRSGAALYVSGMTGIDVKMQKLAGPTIQEQTRQAIRNCEAVLRAAGASLANVVEVQALLARPEDFAGFNEAYAESFASDPPTRSVGRLGPDLPGLLVSIRMTAAVAD